MTMPNTPRPGAEADLRPPAGDRSRSAPGRHRRPDDPSLAESVATARVIALVAVLVAAVALGLAAWTFFAPGSPGCQRQAWEVGPAPADLPPDWQVQAQQYDIDRKTMSLLGPVTDEATGAQGVVYVTITCFAEGAADAVTLSEQAARDAGQQVTDRDDLGEQAFSSSDATGSTFLQLRHGPIVVYLAASGDAAPADVDRLASAFDRALGGDGGAVSVASPEAPGTASPEPEPTDDLAPESPAPPGFEGVLPTTVAGVDLVAASVSGTDILTDDQGSRAILAALDAEGLDAAALQVAQAYDPSGALDLEMLALAVDGMELAKVEDLVLTSWLSATGAGVSRTPEVLGADEWIRLEYSGSRAKVWVRAHDDIVYVITTADPALAVEAAAAIP